MYKIVIKPFLDFVFALSALIILSPFLIVIIVFLLFLHNGKVFFIQERPGKNGRIFRLIKFRTMKDNRGPDGSLLPDHLRVTRIGWLIRTFSLDELPQLLNIISGDMSFVGPRPLLKQYLQLYTPHQARRHEIRPGLTGWAQVNGRNSITWNEKFMLDVWYVDNISFFLDVKIYFITILRVLMRNGINSSEHYTMKAFNGKN